ncbi:MAG: transcription elongation factor Spt5 [Candidatus Bathyarchaeia archaeon]
MIYAVRTTSGQEKTAARLISSRIALKKLPVASIFVPEVIKGYLFIEAPGPHVVDEAITGVKHARGRTKGTVDVNALERFIITKPVIEELAENAIVEVVGGPFKGLKAKITNIDRVKEEVTIELQEEGFALLPITVHADYVKPAEKQRGEADGREKAG